MQTFLSIQEEISIPNAFLEKLTPSPSEKRPPEKLTELIKILNNIYQTHIIRLNNTGMQADSLIETAEALQKVTTQYHCQLLAGWTSTLKNSGRIV